MGYFHGKVQFCNCYTLYMTGNQDYGQVGEL
jgi:hypothetical protein